MDYMKITIDDIFDWCVKNNQVQWIKENVVEPNTFIQIKIAFVKKFMPEIMPKAKPAKPTMYDRAKEL